MNKRTIFITVKIHFIKKKKTYYRPVLQTEISYI